MGNPHSGCFGKTPYRTPKEAARAMKALAKRRKAKQHNGIHPYRCDYCSAWHLGRKPGANLKKLNRDRLFIERRSRTLHSPSM